MQSTISDSFCKILGHAYTVHDNNIRYYQLGFVTYALEVKIDLNKDVFGFELFEPVTGTLRRFTTKNPQTMPSACESVDLQLRQFC